MGFVPETSGRSDAVARDMERIAKRLRALEGGGGVRVAHHLTSQSVAIPIDGTSADTGLTVTYTGVAGRRYLITWHQMIEHTSGSLNEIFEVMLCSPNVSQATAWASSGFFRAHYTGTTYMLGGQYVHEPGVSGPAAGPVTWRIGARAGTGVGAGRAWASGLRQSSLVAVDLGAA